MLGFKQGIESDQKTPIENQFRLHASKDKLYTLQASFMVPKGSPLNVSLTCTSEYRIDKMS